MLTGRWLAAGVSPGMRPGGLRRGQTLGETALIPIDHPSIQYDTRPRERPRHASQPGSGQWESPAAPRAADGYLPGLLQALGVNPDSQSLVFSKTSFQAARIDPRNPRALYFSDDVVVGFVRGSNLLEVAALDPKQGMVFYSFDGATHPPRFDRRDACLQCHTSPGTLGIPGLLIASSYTDASGMPAFRGGQRITDDRTPFEDRWGGWYVTGTHGGMRHIGNAVGHDPAHPEVLDLHDTQNITSLAKKFDSRGYLSGLSDIVALMTLEHQTRMTNLMIRAGWEARIAELPPVTRPRSPVRHGSRIAGDVHVVRRRSHAPRSGGRRVHVYQDLSRSAGRATTRAVPCAISICRSGCSVIRSAT